jgi:glycosyltransferase involved in cell wall biosynthesis
MRDTSRKMKNNNRNDYFFEIGLIGYLNYGNFGDQLFLEIYNFYFPNSLLLVNQFDPKEVDFIIHCGGDIIMEYYVSDLYFNKNLLQNTKIFMNSISVDFCDPTNINHYNQKYGVTHNREQYAQFFKNESIKNITVRDKKSYDHLMKTYESINHKVNLSVDISFLLYKQLYNLKNRQVKCDENRILVIVKHENYQKYVPLIKFLDSINVKVDLMSLSLNGQEREKDKKIKLNVQFYDTVEECIDKINKYKTIISSRFHGILVGLMLNKNVFTMERTNKCMSIMEEFGLSKNVLNTYDIYSLSHCWLFGEIDYNELLEEKYELARLNMYNLKKQMAKYLKTVHLGSKLYGESDIINHMDTEFGNFFEEYNFVDLELYKRVRKEKLFHPIRERNLENKKKYSRYMNIINDTCIDKIKGYQPKLVIFNSGGITYPDESKDELSEYIKLGITLSDPDVFYYMTKYYYEKFDVITSNSEEQLEVYEHGNKYWLPFGVSNRINHDLGLDRVNDIIVVGGCRPDRVAVMDKLFALNKYKIKVCGKNWPENYNAVFVSGEEQNKVINESEIYLSFSRTVAGYNNVKVGLFEAMASGAVCITDTDKIFDFYDHESVLHCDFEDIDKLEEVIDMLLESDELMDKYRHNGMKKTVENYTWGNILFRNVISKLF